MQFNIGDGCRSTTGTYYIIKCNGRKYDIRWDDGEIMYNILESALAEEFKQYTYIPSSLTLLKAIKNASNSQQE